MHVWDLLGVCELFRQIELRMQPYYKNRSLLHRDEVVLIGAPFQLVHSGFQMVNYAGTYFVMQGSLA